MSRTIDSGLLTALQGLSIDPYFACEFMFDSGAVRLWTGLGDKDITVRGASQTFTGSGNLLTISGLEEIGDLSAKSVTVKLSGLPASVVSLALSENYQRRRASIYFGELSQSAVVEVFSGKMNTMRLVDKVEASEVEVTIESKLVELARASNYRYTNDSHLARQPGDTFFSYVQSIQDVSVPWGRKTG